MLPQWPTMRLNRQEQRRMNEASDHPEIRREQALPIDSARGAPSVWARFLAAMHLIQVRLRFVAVLLLVFLIVGNWETISHYWQRWVNGLGLPALEPAVSS